MRPAAAISALLFSGLVQALIAPPLSWIALHAIAWVPALAVIAALPPRHALLAGWLVGASANAAIFHWLVHTVGTFSNLPHAVGVLVLLLFAAVFGLYAGVFALGFGWVRGAAGPAWPFAVAAWFTACEFLNPQLFPYQQGVAWYEHPEVFLVASATGVSGVSFGVILVNALVLQGIGLLRGRESRRAFAACVAGAAALLAASFLYATSRLERIEAAERSAAPLRLGLVQSLHDEARVESLLRDSRDAVARDLAALAGEALERDPAIDVLVLPEQALILPPDEPRNAAVAALARRGVELWAGALDVEYDASDRRRSFNSAFRVDARGEIAGPRYDKIVLVPFGEYMPLVGVLPFLAAVEGVGRFTPGRAQVVHDAPGARFAFLICYEAILPGSVREAVRAGADLLVNVTYDAWYGTTSEPWQHLMLAAVQAAQAGVPVVRSTTTGISALIDAAGRITHRSGLWTREVLVGEVRPLHVESPWTRFGELFAWGTVAVSALLLARAALAARSSG